MRDVPVRVGLRSRCASVSGAEGESRTRTGLPPPDLGFVRKQEDFGSLWSIGRYHAFLDERDPHEKAAIRDQLLLYNEEDCLAMRHVLAWAQTLT